MKPNRDAERSVEREVLSVYSHVNPSDYGLAGASEAFSERERTRRHLMHDQLKFPTRMFSGARLLDFGAGSGQNSVFYAAWGADCTLVEMEAKSLDLARQTFQEYVPQRPPETFLGSLFDYDDNEGFDIVHSSGVLHHTADGAGGFDHMVRFLRPGGYAILGISTAAGVAQRMLQRLIVFAFGNSEDEIIGLAERFFPEHINRAAQYGGRSPKAVVYDAFINPQWDCPSVSEVLTWFRRNELQLYSAWPPLIPPLLGDSGVRATFEPAEVPSIGAMAEMAWLTHDIDDAEEQPSFLETFGAFEAEQSNLTLALSNFSADSDLKTEDFTQLVQRYRAEIERFDPLLAIRAKTLEFLDEFESVMAFVEAQDCDGLASYLQQTKHLFKGTSGLGTALFVGYRPENDAQTKFDIHFQNPRNLK